MSCGIALLIHALLHGGVQFNLTQQNIYRRNERPPYGTNHRASYHKYVEPAFDTAAMLQQVAGQCRCNVFFKL